MKKHFNKELVMTKKENKDFKTPPNAWYAMFIFMVMLK